MIFSCLALARAFSCGRLLPGPAPAGGSLSCWHKKVTKEVPESVSIRPNALSGKRPTLAGRDHGLHRWLAQGELKLAFIGARFVPTRVGSLWPPGGPGSRRDVRPNHVIPAKAGTHAHRRWTPRKAVIPAKAGIHSCQRAVRVDPGLRRDDELSRGPRAPPWTAWIPACTGMTRSSIKIPGGSRARSTEGTDPAQPETNLAPMNASFSSP